MSSPRDQAAFTLIEILVALVILSTGIVVVLEAFETSLFTLAQSRDTTRASRILAEKAAELDVLGIRKGTSGVESGAGVFSVSTDWKGRVDVETDPLSAGAVSGTLHRVEISLWREESDARFGAVTFLRTEPGQ